MSYFAFPKDKNGNIQVTDESAAEAAEILINQITLLNLRFEEAFRTKVYLNDVTDEDTK
jgi:hypothetical protein